MNQKFPVFTDGFFTDLARNVETGVEVMGILDVGFTFKKAGQYEEESVDPHFTAIEFEVKEWGRGDEISILNNIYEILFVETNGDGTVEIVLTLIRT